MRLSATAPNSLLALAAGGAIWAACLNLTPEEPASHFPLEGLHEPLECEDCHTTPLGPVPEECSHCHGDVRPEGHSEGVKLGECDDCHTSFGWDQIGGTHSFFPTMEAHDVPCETCHTTEGVYSGLDGACESCHGEARPEDHYPNRDCVDCHSVEGWEVSDHDHQCEIPHEGYGECRDCHLEWTFDPFSCTHCHEHAEEPMADVHGPRPAYIWESPACLECHQNCSD